MRSKLLNEGPPRTWAVVMDAGDEVVRELTRFADEQRLSAAHLEAIGAFERAVIRYFDWDAKAYCPNRVDEQVEVVGFTGNISLTPDGKRKAHIHAVLGKRDGAAVGGDLGEAVVRPTLEVVVTEEPSYLRRKEDPESGLALIAL